MKYFLTWIFTIAVLTVFAQEGKTIRYQSHYSMFPDTVRSKGHDYNGKHYDAESHYNDSSVFIYLPKSYKPGKITNLVFWFHGWGNNIDSALHQYQLLEQFDASERNAVFIFPEGPKNAPDSYGGKLEQPAVFQELVKEVAGKIGGRKKAFRMEDFSITLAGHSGAYRVISRILNYTPVKEVILFDAMYGGNEAYLKWLSDASNRFINIYTKDGGTFDNSQFIMKQLSDTLHVPYLKANEESIGEKELRGDNKLFIYSSKGHNEVITNNRNWERFLRFVPVAKN